MSTIIDIRNFQEVEPEDDDDQEIHMTLDGLMFLIKQGLEWGCELGSFSPSHNQIEGELSKVHQEMCDTYIKNRRIQLFELLENTPPSDSYFQ